MDRYELVLALENYNSAYREESYYMSRFKSLITNFPNCYNRSLLSGHITASSWIVNKGGTSALLIYHRKLNRWLQPGGHADGNEDVLAVAAREAAEETGLKSLHAHQNFIFDLDIHLIPVYRNIKAHFHFDIRFLFIANQAEECVINHESNDIAWYPLDDIGKAVNDNPSIQRMVLKSKSIFK